MTAGTRSKLTALALEVRIAEAVLANLPSDGGAPWSAATRANRKRYQKFQKRVTEARDRYRAARLSAGLPAAPAPFFKPRPGSPLDARLRRVYWNTAATASFAT